MALRFEWDGGKAELNEHKHGVSFEEAQRVFGDHGRIEMLEWHRNYGEDRFVTTGRGRRRLLTVIYVERGERLRIISARRATRAEEATYYENNG